MAEQVICNSTLFLTNADWDAMALTEISAGKGFRITEKGISDTEHTAGKYSIHSPLYGTDYRDDHAFEDRYSCECGNLTGKNYNGITCPKCKKKVEFVDIDMTITGWIILDNDYIIQSIFFKKIRTFIGPKIFEAIINFVDPVQRQPVEGQPFAGIGITEFRERFDEIMNYYYKNNARKISLYRFIMSQKEVVFAHAIPVYSSHLRPFIISGNEIKYSDTDKLYKLIFTNSQLLNDDFELTRRIVNARKKKKYSVDYLRREKILYTIQQNVNKLWDLSFDTIKKKTGILRASIIGGRLNFTARNVIIPDKTLRTDEIGLGYTTVLELFKLEIISLLVNMQGISYKEAWARWEKASITYDDLIYKIMVYMISDPNKPQIVEINRNPTINYGSELVMKIAKINPDMNDYCMALPISILTPLNADFDGDVLNIISFKITDMAEEFYRQLNPRSNITISRNDGGYNLETAPMKDQLVVLYAFANA